VAAVLVSFLAGFLFSNPAYADPPPLEALVGQNKTVDAGIFTITSNTFPAILYANGGTISTAPGGLTLNVETSTTGASALNGGSITLSNSNFNHVNDGLSAATAGTINATDVNIVLVTGPSTVVGAQVDGVGSTLTLTGGSITMDGVAGPQSIGLRAQNGATLIADGTDIGGTTGGLNKSAEASTGGHIELFNLSITQNFVGVQHGALEVSGGGTISTDHVDITTSQFNEYGAFAQGGSILLQNTTITTSGDIGAGIWAENATFGPPDGRQSTIEADNTVITTSGGNAYGAIALFGGIVTLNSSTVTTSGGGANGVYSFFESTVNVTGSTVTAGNANAGQVVDGSVMTITDSELTGGTNGIRISDDDHTVGPDTLTVSGSTLTNQAGNSGEAAIRVDGAETDITLNNSTVNSGTGAGVTQHTFLNVTSIDRAGNAFASAVNLTANSSTLNGDILSDADSTTSVSLHNNTTLTGAVNENQLTGASGINPTEQVTHPISPGLPPQTVNLSIDSTSSWNMRASSTLNTLDVSPRAHVFFADPPADPFKTLVMNNLTGTGGIFTLNNDLATIKGDLINILNSSQGGHLVLFNNRTAGSDLPVDTALLVVKTTDGQAVFGGAEDGGTFLYFVRRGNGSSITPVTTNWYLVRGDEITPPSPSPSPPPSPSPSPFPSPTIPPNVLPPDILPPGPISPIDDLTAAANAAIGTFSATMPLFYADMDTLVQRLGELRLLALAPPPAPPTGLSKEGGKETVTPPPPVAPPAGGGLWFRGFGSGSHIDDQVSRSFDQNVGGFQIGADKRFITRYGDLYLGVFSGYFYAHRDFGNEFFGDSTGTTNAFSAGAYSTLIHPSGFYADLVAKYTQLWNDFDAPNFSSFLGLGPNGRANYSIPTFGGSLEIGKRWDFGHVFLEPQGQIEGAWAGGTDYTVSTGLRVDAGSQTSLRGRLGVRAGLHFDWGSRAFEPYAKVSATNEFLGGDRITTNQTSFFPTLSGVGIQAGGGVTAKITDSIYLYGEYDYANNDKVRIPWAVNAGLRWKW